MNYRKNAFIIGGAIVFLILTVLAWNYTEAIKERNAIEKQRITSAAGTSKTVDLMEKKQECTKYLAPFLKRFEEGVKGEIYMSPEVCYDKIRNTCIVIEQAIWNDNGEKEVTITDLLTNKTLFYQPIAKDDPMSKYWNTEKLISDNSDCAQ